METEKLLIEKHLGGWLRSFLPLSLAEFILFGAKLAWATLFAALMLFAIITTKYLYPTDATLQRYDFLVILALSIQALMIILKLESMNEVKVILLFHISGTIMEVFKLAQGSWDYPEQGIFEIGGVPLFSGFMYASVGSFMARAIRIFDMRFEPFPKPLMGYSLAFAIYINFFTHHYIIDFRWLLIALTLFIFGTTWIAFQPLERWWRLPLVLCAFLSSIFLYIAENIGTLTGTWVYGGNAVIHFTDPAKITSWYLLLFVSFMQVSIVYQGTHHIPSTQNNRP